MIRDKAHYVGSTGVDGKSIDGRHHLWLNRTRYDPTQTRVTSMMTGTYSCGIDNVACLDIPQKMAPDEGITESSDDMARAIAINGTKLHEVILIFCS